MKPLEQLGHVQGGVLDLLRWDKRVVGEVLDEARKQHLHLVHGGGARCRGHWRCGVQGELSFELGHILLRGGDLGFCSGL